MEIIPAIDLIDGRCVRLTEGDFSRRTTYHDDPLEVAQRFERLGVRRLHLVDLDGARTGSIVNWKVLERIASATGLVVDFGGGIKTEDDVRRVLDNGAAYATVGSVAVRDESLLLEWFGLFGADRFLIGADVRAGRMAVAGWQETTEEDVLSFIGRYMAHGMSRFFCTDVGRDGRLEGPAADLYRTMMDSMPGLELIASGGISCLADLDLLASIGCSGAIVGKAIYENRISEEELKAYISKNI